MTAEPEASAAEPLQPRPRSTFATATLATLASVAALWWGQRFLVPLAAGVMLAMLLLPMVLWVGKVLHSIVLATVIALLTFLVVMAAAATSFGGQLARVADRVPEMISLAALRLSDTGPNPDSALTRARMALQELDRAADRLVAARASVAATTTLISAPRAPKAAAAAAAAAAPAASAPGAFSAGATVALRETAVTGSSMLLKFAGDLSIIIFVAFFVLSGGAPLTDRLLDQWSYSTAARYNAAHALRECALQVRQYVRVLLVTNVLVGLAVWGLFALSGLPDAAGWGVAAAVLHVVPYVGMAVLTGLGASEAFLAHGTLAATFGVAGALVLISTLIGTVVTAWLQGRASGMNPAAVFIGLVFWGALWGIWGLFLGPALVVVAKVIAEHSRSGQRVALLLKS